MLSQEQVNFYQDRGWLHLPGMFDATQTQAMRDDLNWLIDTWADRSKGWTGPWRKQYMDEATEQRSQLVAMHDLHFYSEAWMKGVTHSPLAAAIADLVDGPVELHHSTMHVKPPESGHPFPMHQDWAFYQHEDGRFVDVLVHLDDTSHANGEIRFVDGSHRDGPLEHVVRDPATGEPCTPHLPFEQYSLENTTAVPARAGDVVLFSIHTLHGSHINTTDDMRRMVRVGYRHPDNRQTAGQSCGRPGLMVHGRRQRQPGQALFTTEGPRVEATAGVE
ncbi:MAG: phytanoyl-CoA dioxygenase family protein [Phycisphaeraceae bacterium]